MKMIPLIDLGAQYDAIKDEVDQAISRVIASSEFIGGQELSQFELNFASWCGVQHCAGVANGTDAIYLALRGLGVGKGDEVISVSHTFTATCEAIHMTGARPVFVDILKDTMLMDPDHIEAVITERTKAIIAVHLYGQVCNMDRISEICTRQGIKLIEDAAQAHGATWSNQKAGSMGDVACFSFYPGKNLGAFGDAGAVVSDNGDLISEIRSLANHGRLSKYLHKKVGSNSRLDNLQAAVLSVKLRHLDSWNNARRLNAEKYINGFRGLELDLPKVDDRAKSVWHLFVIGVMERERFQEALKDQGISSGIHYPVPLHLQPAYEGLNSEVRSLPVTESIANRVISLPMYPELNDDQIEKVISAVDLALR